MSGTVGVAKGGGHMSGTMGVTGVVVWGAT